MATDKERELAWAAGFFEGEGSCIIHWKGALQVAVYQNGNTWPLNRLQATFGGGIHEYARKGVRKTGGPFKPQGQWTVYGPTAAVFLQAILPELSPRRQEQVQSCLDRWSGLKQWQQAKNGKE